jgi:biopolymer transport protein ExbD
MNLRGRNKVRAEFSMASMTDIVFLLLIFFMLTSTLVTSSALDIVLPKSKAQSVKREYKRRSDDQSE